jgi:hypothetical protein
MFAPYSSKIKTSKKTEATATEEIRQLGKLLAGQKYDKLDFNAT